MGNCVLFDWGDTLMRTFDYPGPMCFWPRMEVMPGALETLRVLHGRIGLALATNAADSQEHEIRKALAMGGLAPYLEPIFCFRAVGHKKASPPFFRHVMERLGASTDELVLVGDDFEQDVTAAHAQGIKAVWFNFRDHETRSGADFRTIHELQELPAALERWGFLPPGKP